MSAKLQAFFEEHIKPIVLMTDRTARPDFLGPDPVVLEPHQLEERMRREPDWTWLPLGRAPTRYYRTDYLQLYYDYTTDELVPLAEGGDGRTYRQRREGVGVQVNITLAFPLYDRSVFYMHIYQNGEDITLVGWSHLGSIFSYGLLSLKGEPVTTTQYDSKNDHAALHETLYPVLFNRVRELVSAPEHQVVARNRQLHLTMQVLPHDLWDVLPYVCMQSNVQRQNLTWTKVETLNILTITGGSNIYTVTFLNFDRVLSATRRIGQAGPEQELTTSEEMVVMWQALLKHYNVAMYGSRLYL